MQSSFDESMMEVKHGQTAMMALLQKLSQQGVETAGASDPDAGVAVVLSDIAPNLNPYRPPKPKKTPFNLLGHSQRTAARSVFSGKNIVKMALVELLFLIIVERVRLTDPHCFGEECKKQVKNKVSVLAHCAFVLLFLSSANTID
jgi:hypothetical protein